MTENANEPTAQLPDQPREPATPDQTDRESPEDATPQSKEARYRIRAREAEKTASRLRDSLTSTRRTMLVAEATRRAHLHPSAAKDICTALDTDHIDELFDSDGAIDATAFDRFMARTVAERPYLVDNRPKAPAVPGQGRTPTNPNVNHWENSFGGV